MKIEICENTLHVLFSLVEKIFGTGAKAKINLKFNYRANPRVDNSEELTPLIESIQIEIE